MAGLARADHAPQLLDGPNSGFEIGAQWMARRTWAPHALLPVYMEGASGRDVLIVQHLHGDSPWGPEQRCVASDVAGDVITFVCPAIDALVTQELGAHSMALSYRRHDQQGAEPFVTVFYTVARYQREE